MLINFNKRPNFGVRICVYVFMCMYAIVCVVHVACVVLSTVSFLLCYLVKLTLFCLAQGDFWAEVSTPSSMNYECHPRGCFGHIGSHSGVVVGVYFPMLHVVGMLEKFTLMGEVNYNAEEIPINSRVVGFGIC